MAVGAWRSERGRGCPRTAGGVVIQAGVSQGGWFALHRLFLRTSRLKGQTLIEGGESGDSAAELRVCPLCYGKL